MANIDATDARLNTHEEVCAMRYEQINAQKAPVSANGLPWVTE